MSGSPTQGTTEVGHASAQGADPSMEDILASIRRILSEEEAVINTPSPAGPSPQPAPPPPSVADEVLELDESMIVHDETPENDIVAEPAPEPIAAAPAPMEPRPASIDSAMTAGIMAPAAAAAAASSVGDLVRTLTVERSMQVRSAGPSIEDIVREEIRVLLKNWLDENLPPIVERLVRIEIERVVGRVVP